MAAVLFIVFIILLNFPFTVVLLFTSLMRVSQQSITGVTFIDNIDFEESYRNYNECNPLYWHPLHLPSECAKKYEKMIRSKLADHSSIKFVKPKVNDPFGINRYEALITELLENISGDGQEEILYGYQYNYRQGSFNHHYFRSRQRLPFEFMLDALREDVIKDPSQPQIEIMPNFGMVAVYRQPISRKSEDIIKNIALDYGKAGAESYIQSGLYTPSTSKPEMYMATGVYHKEERNGPSRTHYELKFYPGLTQSGIVPSQNIMPIQSDDDTKKRKQSK